MMKSVLAAALIVTAVVSAPAASAGVGHSGKGSTTPDPRSNAAVVRQIADQIKHCHG